MLKGMMMDRPLSMTAGGEISKLQLREQLKDHVLTSAASAA